MVEALGIKRNLPLCPERCLRLGGRIDTGLNGVREGLLFEEKVITIFGAPQQGYRVALVTRHAGKWLAGKIESPDHCLKFAKAGDKHAVLPYCPVLAGLVT